MAIVRPFRALRPFPEQAAAVAAVPYDVVNTEEARQLAFNNHLSFLHVSRPEIDLPDGTDMYSDAAYDKAAATIAGMFHENFAAYADGVSEGVRAAGPVKLGAALKAKVSAPGEG